MAAILKMISIIATVITYLPLKEGFCASMERLFLESHDRAEASIWLFAALTL